MTKMYKVVHNTGVFQSILVEAESREEAKSKVEKHYIEKGYPTQVCATAEIYDSEAEDFINRGMSVLR